MGTASSRSDSSRSEPSYRAGPGLQALSSRTFYLREPQVPWSAFDLLCRRHAGAVSIDGVRGP